MKLPDTPDEIAAELLMLRSQYPKSSLVLVEGHDDGALWTEYKPDRCRLVLAGNKEKAVAALQITNERTTLRGVAAIIDPDYWLVEDSELLNTENLLYDDSPDMETMLLNNSTVRKVMRHLFVSLETDRVHEFADTLLEDSLRLAAEYGYFRLLDYRYRKHNLRLKTVADNLASYLDDTALELRTAEIAETLLGESHTLSVADLQEKIVDLQAEVPSSLALCRGKDASFLLSLLLPLQYKRFFKRDMSQRARKQTTGNELRRFLRTAFDWTCFITTALYRRIREWEASHSPFRIIRDFPTEGTPA